MIGDDPTPMQFKPKAGVHQGLRHQALGGLAWMLSGAGAQALLRIVFLMVVARALGPTAFGVAAAALVVVTRGLAVAQLGLSRAIIQRPQLEERHLRTAFTLAVISGVLGCAALQLLAPYIAAFFQFDGLTEVLRVLSLALVLSNVGLVADGLTRRKCEFRRVATILAGSFAIGFGVVGIGLALLGAGVWALVGAHLTQHALRSAALLRFQPHRKAPSLDWQTLKELIYLGGGMTVWRIGNVAAFQLDNLVVGRWLGAEALGLYGRAFQLMSMPASVLGQAMMEVIFPLMSQVQHQAARLGVAFRRGSATVALLALPAATLVTILAPELVAVVLGAQWQGAVVPLQILAVGVLFRLAHRLSESVTNAMGAVYATGLRQAVYAGLVFLGALVGQNWGLPGVAAGVLVALAIHFLVMVELCLRLTGLPWRDFLLAHRPGVALAVILGAETWLISTVLRSYELQPLVIGVICAAASALTFLGVLAFGGRALLGADGLWVIQAVLSRLRKRSAPRP
jgi:PST family polysaccharide transporter